MPTSTANTTESMPSAVQPETNQPEFVLSRLLDAPRDLVYKAFTEADRLAHWWSPKGFTLRTCTLDLRPGGVFHYCQASEGGQEMWGKFVYSEVSPPERLVYVSSFADEQGNTVRAPFSDTWPVEILNTVTFIEQDGKTLLTMTGSALNASEAERTTFAESSKMLEAGWGGTLKQLEDYLATA